MLNVYKEQIGTCEVFNRITREWNEVNIYTCTGLMEAVNDEGNLVFFFSDLNHLKKCLGLNKGYDNIIKGWIDNFRFKKGIRTDCGTTTNQIIKSLKEGGIYAETFSN